MGVAPPRPCARCHRLVRGRCPTCQGERDHARGNAAARGYDRAWAAYSRRWLLQYPACGMRRDGRFHVEHSRCVSEGRIVPATCTDHIRPLRYHGAKFDPANHQSLCTSCNNRKGKTSDRAGLA